LDFNDDRDERLTEKEKPKNVGGRNMLKQRNKRPNRRRWWIEGVYDNL